MNKMNAVQARIRFNSAWYGGILLPDHDLVIFADDGSIMSLKDDEIDAVIPFNTWINIEEDVLGCESAIPTDEEYEMQIGKDRS